MIAFLQISSVEFIEKPNSAQDVLSIVVQTLSEKMHFLVSFGKELDKSEHSLASDLILKSEHFFASKRHAPLEPSFPSVKTHLFLLSLSIMIDSQVSLFKVFSEFS